MKRRKKRELSEIPGSPSAMVVSNDLKTALYVFKKELKQSGKISEIYKRKEYEKPSTRRRRVKETAKYLNQFK